MRLIRLGLILLSKKLWKRSWQDCQLRLLAALGETLICNRLGVLLLLQVRSISKRGLLLVLEHRCNYLLAMLAKSRHQPDLYWLLDLFL